jgi:ubiquinone/menaquinone biosynthesis C-methylase UbiE/uncharacterized protein YbaR (Trm112 family)
MTTSVNSCDFHNGPLRCPLTGSRLQLLDNAEEVLSINMALKKGDLTLAAGAIPGGVIDGVLISAMGKHKYPIIAGIPCLLDDFRIVKPAENDPAKEISLQMSALQRKQWVAFSKQYEKWLCEPDGIITRVQEEFQRRNASLLSKKGATILDVGNGGATSNQQLGKEIASSIDTFYALDSSYPMLTRNGINAHQILGDATSIPLSDKSIDFVIINNTLHHFGLHRDSDSSEKMKAFFDEAFRVSRNGIIGVEMLVPHIAEHIEKLFLQFLKFMPTFVYSEKFYSRLIANLDAEIVEFESISQRKLVSPFWCGPPIMDIPFIKFPAFLTPYSFLFYHLKPGKSQDASNLQLA